MFGVIFVLLSLCLLYSTESPARIFIHSSQACRLLALHPMTPSPLDRYIFEKAAQLSSMRVPIYLEPANMINRVAHIPGAPYLTAVAGRHAQCVAVAPEWLNPLGNRERTWLVLVGLAGLHHPHTYRIMLKAAEDPPSGIFASLADWWGKRRADRAILHSEAKATQWLEGNRRVALSALSVLRKAPRFSGDKWLPAASLQEDAVASITPSGKV